MSELAAWSYTSTATHWPRTGRDDWSGALTFGPPVTFACDYTAEAKRMTDARGVEFTSMQTLHTEKDDVVQGDMVLIGVHTEQNPITAGAQEVRVVKRFADTFNGAADDFALVT